MDLENRVDAEAADHQVIKVYHVCIKYRNFSKNKLN